MEKSPDLLNDNIIYLASSFAHHFSRLMTLSLQNQKIPLTAEQFAVLALLARNDGLPQQEISRTLERDKTTVTRSLINLKSQGLIRQQSDKTDARAKQVYITTKGRKLQARALQIGGNLYTIIMQNISEKDIKKTVMMLQQMNTAIKNVQ